MLEILQFYVSDIWVWFGITFGAYFIIKELSAAIISIIQTCKGHFIDIDSNFIKITATRRDDE
ncbi:hypothetical protein [Roseibium sp. RKSG952]|uniref:hypothetical protein n=1 Tax=Roseibium sp. RKSG952 TaxID=2529384 RepID=UPI0012BD2828|nr:hypothetical protein [Roseibium sp. RKSG952]MTH95531.1 hypothetical protein [Roseibium sp. RKSG952]